MKSATTLIIQTTCNVMTMTLIVGTLCLGSALGQQQNQRPVQNQPQPQQSKQIQTLAVVNGKSISRQQVANECVRRFGNEVLKSIINKQLVFAECQKRGINITEQDVNTEIANRGQQFKMSANDYIKLITSRRNISVDRLKNDVIWSELALRRLAATELKVSKEEINERIEFEYGPRVQVREIALNTAEEAQQVLNQLQQQGADFGTLAKDLSVNPNSAAVRGLLPPIRRNSGMPQFEQVAFSLQPGQVSNVFQIENRFIILQCERVFPATELTQEQIAQVNDKIVEDIRNKKLGTAASQLFDRLR